MKINDLRIGNLVECPSTKRIGYIISIGLQHVSVKYAKSTNKQTYPIGVDPPLNGILLNESCFLLLGFEKGSDIIGECFYIESNDGNDFLIRIENDKYFFDELEIKLKNGIITKWQ